MLSASFDMSAVDWIKFSTQALKHHSFKKLGVIKLKDKFSLAADLLHFKFCTSIFSTGKNTTKI